MEERTYTINYEKLVKRLVEKYEENPLWVGKMCDEALDQTGKLLGVVRSKYLKEKYGWD